jgi:O-antigen ligase
MATRGGTDRRDLTIVSVLLATAFLATIAQTRIHLQRVPSPGTAMWLTLLIWVIVDGPLRLGVNLTTVRIPILILAVFLTVRTLTLLNEAQRAPILQGLIILGTIHGSIAITQTTPEFISGMNVTQLPRAESLLGNANALGVVLVATATLTLRELQRRRGKLLGVALAIQSIALLLTGSRLAILTGLCVLGWYWATKATWRTRALLLPWLIMASLVFALRFIHSMPEPRLYLWAAAVERIALQPVTGHGPAPEVYNHSLAAARLTAHAHNELLQWTAEYGFVGLLLVAGTVILALASTHSPGPRDGFLVAAAASLLASGLTDFSLRITAITITSAALATAAFVPAHQPEERSRDTEVKRKSSGPKQRRSDNNAHSTVVQQPD